MAVDSYARTLATKALNSGGGGTSAVSSVNGKIGTVVLNASDVGALSDNATLADLTEDETHRVVSDTEKATWNGKSDLALGETSSTAYAGNKGKANADNIASLQSGFSNLKVGSECGGANIWDEEWEVGIINPTTGANLNYTTRIRSTNYISVKPSTDYYIAITTNTLNVIGYDANKSAIGFLNNGSSIRGRFTIPSNVYFIRWYLAQDTYGTTYKNDIAIIEGTSGSYEPHIPSVAMLSDSVESLESKVDTLAYGESGSKNFIDLRTFTYDGNAMLTSYSISEDTITVKSSTDTNWNPQIRYLWNIPSRLAGKTVTFSRKANYSPINYERVVVEYYKQDGTYERIIEIRTEADTFTMPTSDVSKKLRFTFYVSYTTNEVKIYDIQLELGSVATDYVPYLPYSVKTLGNATNDLKMLGYSVPSECPVQNVVSGNTFTQKVCRVDLGSLSWEYDTNNGRFVSSSIAGKFVSTSGANKPNMYCEKYEITSYNNRKNNCICVGYPSNNLFVLDSNYTDANTFKQAMQGVYLYYELATPITKNVDGNECSTNKKVHISSSNYYVYNSMATTLVFVKNEQELTQGQTFTLCTLVEGARPSETVYKQIFIRGTRVEVEIFSTGNVVLTPTSNVNANYWAYDSFTFLH